MRLLLVLFAMAVMAFFGKAHAVEKLPVRFIYGKTHEDKQYGYTTLDIRADGYYRFEIKFSNGKEIDGDHFFAYAIIYAKDDSVLRAFSAFAGVKGGYACPGACERTFVWDGQFTEAEIEQIANVGSFHGQYNVVDDKKAVEDVKKVIENLGKTIGFIIAGDYAEGAGALMATGKAYVTLDKTLNPEAPILRPIAEGEAIQLMDLAVVTHDIPRGTFANPAYMGKMIEVRNPGGIPSTWKNVQEP